MGFAPNRSRATTAVLAKLGSVRLSLGSAFCGVLGTLHGRSDADRGDPAGSTWASFGKLDRAWPVRVCLPRFPGVPGTCSTIEPGLYGATADRLAMPGVRRAP